MINAAARLRHWLKRQPNPMLSLALALRDPFVHPRVIDPQPGERVLVLAPHMDDEAIGCGGALLRHIGLGADVTVVYLSDGTAGDARLYDAAVPVSQHPTIRSELYAIRRAEANEWCRRAAVTGVEFLDGPDGRLGASVHALAPRLATLFAAKRPHVVYLPSPLDTHPDHRAANALLAQALRDRDAEACVLRGYEVWSPLVANTAMDITAVVGRKLELLALYRSQLKDVDYARAIAGLNAYRAMLLPARAGHAEAFVEIGVGAHRHLLRQTGW